jgi:DNA topoisomerase-1
VLAAVVRLLDTEYIRIGNDRYAKENKSFGATTLLCRHVKSEGGKVKMRFNGKHGIVHEMVITDRRLGRIVRQCQELPGQPLFQYINGDGTPHPITSADVNEYLREISGGDFTAKHFRTWWASVIAFGMMAEAEEERRKISVQTVVEPVAEALGNTPAISRKSYVHPALIEAVKDDPRNPLPGYEKPRERKWLSATEVGFLKFLEAKEGPRQKRAA